MMQLYPSDSVQKPTIINDLPQVNNSQEAKTQLTRPSTRDVLWDKEENFFYMRVTDAAGQIISFERYEYNPSPEPKMEDIFVSKDDFEKVTRSLEGGLNDVKESIQQLIQLSGNSRDNRPRNKQHSGNGASPKSNKTE